ncbi:glycosyltransferase [Micromonosporaceae bacterium Da 78-11]
MQQAASTQRKFSIVIPYKNRLDTLRLVFAALAEQTMDRDDFEVIVGAMEYSAEYLHLCREYSDRLHVVSVMTTEDWNVGRARNLAIRHASGQVLLTLDADIALPPPVLQTTYDQYFAHQQNVCVAGQFVGYQAAMKQDLDVPEALLWDSYRQTLAELDPDATDDHRWSPEYSSAVRQFPWAFVGSGLVALPVALVRQYDLLFDENFDGWGPEDQEWAYRISCAGIPILHARTLLGLHLPHRRSVTSNDAMAWINNRYYLGKWPRLDLELALAFGWVDAADSHQQLERDLAAAAGHPGRRLAVLRGTVDGRDTVVVGAPVDTGTQTPDGTVSALFDARSPLQVLPLAGLALPYADKTVGEVHILPAVRTLNHRYQEAITREAERASHKVTAG